MSASIVTFSGLRCTKVRRTAAITSISTSPTDQATTTSSPVETQVSTASDPAPRPSVASPSTRTATSAVTGVPETEGTTQATKSSPLASSTDLPGGPAGISSSSPASNNNNDSQKTLRIVVGSSVGAVVVIFFAILAWTLLRRRKNRASRPPVDYYASEKSQPNTRRSLEAPSSKESPVSKDTGGKDLHFSDSLAQLEPLPRATVTSSAGRPQGLPSNPSQQRGMFGRGAGLNATDFSDIQDPFSDSSELQEPPNPLTRVPASKDPFGDPRSPSRPEITLTQSRLLRSEPAFSGLDFGLLRTTPRSSTSRESEGSRGRTSGQYTTHDREESTSSSVIVLPSSAGISERTFSYQPTPTDLTRWRRERETMMARTSARVSTRSDPFDLEGPPMTTYTIAKPIGVDTRWGLTLSSTSNLTIYSPREKEDNR